MKKHLILAALALIAAVACQKTVVPELSVSTNTINLGPQGGQTMLTVTSNQEWTLSASEDWISLASDKGSGTLTVAVSVGAFTETSARSGQVVVKSATLSQTIAVVQSAPVAPAETSQNSFKALALGGTFEMTVPQGYTYTVNSTADWIAVEPAAAGLKLTVAPHANASEGRSGQVEVLFGSSVLAQATIEQSYRNVEPGELLIEEVYFTGSPIEGSTSPSMDQYIKLTNNSDRVVYADGVLFVTNFITGTITSVGAYYEYPELEDGLAVNNMYAIPGKGDEHPLAPGESLILALAAIDYTASYQDGDNVIEGNSNAIDLSRAHFEFYDENDIYPDTDNPDVENLDIWFKTSRTITSLHNRGFESYAIVIPPYDETAETIMTNHHWEGTYFFHFNEWNFDYDLADEDVWVIPGEWVLDAVNCCTEDSFYQNPWPAAFDAGWTHAGDYDRDPARFGKSVRRKTDAAGKLVDTNNSTNDFVPNCAPSLKK